MEHVAYNIKHRTCSI